MNDILKQRLVGALVIIALGVVFWPVVFVDAERTPMDRSSQVPAMPVMKQARIETPSPSTKVEPVAPATDILLHDEPPEINTVSTPAPTTKRSPAKPRLDDAGIPVAWVLQVVSVSKKEKAEALTKQLIDAGYKAYNRPIKRDQGTLYKIYVGPVFDRNKLAKMKKQVDSRLKVNAIIARYVP